MPLIPAAGVILWDGCGYWLTKPLNSYGGYVYTFPKGRVEPGESLQSTAHRECLEETGIEPIITDVFGIYDGDSTRTTYFNGIPKDTVYPHFTSAETESILWVHVNDLHKYLNKPRDLLIADEILHRIPEGR